MNICNLSDRLSRLGDLRQAGATIVLTEPVERTIGVVVAGLTTFPITFDQRLFLANLPSDWQEILPHDSDFESVSADQIEAARRALEQRIGTRSWHLSLPDDPFKLEDFLRDQGAQGITKLFQFQTLEFPLTLVVKICDFRALSVQKVGLDCLLSQAEIQALFTKCRS